MKNKLLKLTTLSLATSSILCAGGYKIPETSTNAVALSAANIAHSTSADAAYYNPANMIFMEDQNDMEVDLMYIGLDGTKFKGSGSMAGINIQAEEESFLIPSINYVSPKLGNARIGLSIVVPGGLTKRWKASPAVDKAEEFTLSVIEINPTVAIPLSDKVAFAVGFRIIHSEGVVKSSSRASRNMIGDSYDYGYNLALSYKPVDSVDIGVTYRSKVDLSEEGNAKLYIGGSKVYDGGASVTVPLPASASFALAYTFSSDTTFELVYERNFWSAYKDLNFNYTSSIPAILQPSMDAPVAKNWNDTSAFRLGFTQLIDDFTLMAGMVYDESPVPDSTLSFELPDSDSLSVSFGGRYDITKKWNIGVSTLYSMREERAVVNKDISGEFSNSNVLIMSMGVGYKF